MRKARLKKNYKHTLDVEFIEEIKDYRIAEYKYVSVPSKILHNLKYFTNLHLLGEDIEEIKEQIILLTSFVKQDIIVQHTGYQNLNAELLKNIFGDKLYRKLLDLLLIGTQNGPILECDNHFIKGSKSRGYRLAKPYQNCKYEVYEFKTDKLLKYRQNKQKEEFKKCKEDVNLRTHLYKNYTLPTLEEIQKWGEHLEREGFITKKGRRLISEVNIKKQPDQNFTTIEDTKKCFDYLTKTGLLIPHYQGDITGGRITTTYSLLPSWIREMIQGLEVELDIKCSHPNNALEIYGSEIEKGKEITHKAIARWLHTNNNNKEIIDLDVLTKQVKTQNLMFFNCEVWQMKTLDVYKYYEHFYPNMLKNIIKEKYNNGYKAVTKKVFEMESNIMHECMQYFYENEIDVVYVYDCFYTSYKNREIVQAKMEEVTKKYNKNLYIQAKMF